MRAVLRCLFCVLTVALFGCEQSAPPPTRSSVITIQIVHGPETRALLGSLRDQFNQAAKTLADGSIVQVELVNDMGLSAALRLARADLKSDGWLAPSTTLVRFSNGSRVNLGPEQGNCVPLFRSPVVAAMRADQMELVGAIDGVFSWNELMRSMSASSPDDGPVISFAHTQPRSAVTGFASLIQLAYLGKGSAALTLEDLQKGSAGRELEKAQKFVFAYPLSESFLLAKSAHSTEKNFRFVFTTEQQVTLYNQVRTADSPELVGLFTKEGTYFEDYQLCTSLADWVTPPRQAGFQLFSQFLQADSSRKAALAMGFRAIPEEEVAPEQSEPPSDSSPEAPSAEPLPQSLPDSHLSGGRLPDGSLPATFPPLSYEVAAHLFEEWPHYRRPAALSIVIDHSGSMAGDSLFLVKEQVRSLLAQTSNNDLKSLITFGSDVKVLNEYTENSSAIISKIDVMQAVGGSALYSSIAKALENAATSDLDTYRRSVLVISDGDDKNSDISLMTLLGMVERLVPRYGIELSIIGIRREGVDFSDLERVAQTADGNFRIATLMELQSVFQDLAKGL